MAAHTSILAWRILWTEEPGRQVGLGGSALDAQSLRRQASAFLACARPVWMSQRALIPLTLI